MLNETEMDIQYNKISMGREKEQKQIFRINEHNLKEVNKLMS